MILAKPAPFVSTFIDAVDEAIRQDHPNQAMSAIQRTWLAFCVTAVLVTNSICWARFERASLGSYSLAYILRYTTECITTKSPAVQLRSIIRATPSLLHSARLSLKIKSYKSLFHCEFSLNHNFLQEMTSVFESK